MSAWLPRSGPWGRWEDQDLDGDLRNCRQAHGGDRWGGEAATRYVVRSRVPRAQQSSSIHRGPPGWGLPGRPRPCLGAPPFQTPGRWDICLPAPVFPPWSADPTCCLAGWHVCASSFCLKVPRAPSRVLAAVWVTGPAGAEWRWVHGALTTPWDRVLRADA